MTPLVLAIETSCDDTCAAVAAGTEIRSNVVASQSGHERFGGVVPEIAARSHLLQIGPVVDEALEQAGVTLDDIQRVAVTAGPGLVGALLIGVQTAKAIAASRSIPLVAVDHLHGHIAANFAAGRETELEPPFLCLVVSGGHTFLAVVVGRGPGEWRILGRTLDDAAGEAIDKAARMLGLGFPGGPELQRLAEGGDPNAFELPRADGVAGLDFSFAGLKTALLYTIRDLGEDEARRQAPGLAASFQHAVVEQLARRTARALAQTGLERLAIGGGVAANGPLRERMQGLGVPCTVPTHDLCTDNAAMIACAAQFTEPLTHEQALGLEVHATGGSR